ncbi:Rop guanine nucleotide exchange factor 9 [Trifolium repens]|nr:Rop guanine nucleotide exchange factor 9 [Trifolium repens]
MFEIPGKHIQGLFDKDEGGDNKVYSKSLESRHSSDNSLETQPIGIVFNNDHAQVEAPKMPPKPPSESDMMKERFAKLLLGEDMSGAGNGVSSALALSNAITNLAASVFGEQSKLEPMSQERKARWRKEIEWLLSVTDHIVEFAPSQQLAKDGSTMEIMTIRQRIDLLMNIPALRKLDAMLIDILDDFRDQNEFWYVSKAADEEAEGNIVTQRKSDKWWLPVVKVPPTGLSDVAVKWIQFQKDNVNQVLKAAMAINAQVLSEMEIPDNYIESLPKNGRESLGESIYKSITVEYFDPGQFLSTMDMSTEHKVLDLKNRIEASIVIWKRKMNKDGKSSWSSAISMEKRELFEERAETILLMIKQQFPGLPQSSLDISKIQYNKDVGQAILESYSRVIESLAYTVLSRIEDVLYVDSMTKNPSLAVSGRRFSLDSLQVTEQTSPHSEDGVRSMNSSGTPPSMTLSDFMGWSSTNDLKRTNSTGDLYDLKEKDEKSPKKHYYLDKLEYLNAIRSPIGRH